MTYIATSLYGLHLPVCALGCASPRQYVLINTAGTGHRRRYTQPFARKASVLIDKDEHGFYAWCPELKGCQSQGNRLEDAVANRREAIELYLQTLPAGERDVLLSREIMTTAVELNG